MNNDIVLDHLVWAVPDLNLAIKELEEKTGVQAIFGGRHPKHGTCNALASLGEGEYFELLARDLSLPAGELAKFCTNLTQPNLVTWVVRTSKINEMAERAKRAGYQAKVEEMSRLRPNGEKLEWKLLKITGHSGSNFVPLVIDWQNCPHPSLDAPKGLKLLSFTIEAIDPTALGEIFSNLEIPVNLEKGEENRLVALLDSPKGKLELTGS